MSKPWIHALESVRKFKGKPEDYLEIHCFMDSSKSATALNTHRALTHTSWFLSTILERIKFKNSIEAADGTFPTIKNSDDKIISVRDIGEFHILSDFHGKFIPTAQDYLQEITFRDWMQNGKGYPPSSQKIEEKRVGELKERVSKLKERDEDVTYDGNNSADFSVRGILLD